MIVSASQCTNCKELVTDLDAGFSPGLHSMMHECGGTWERVNLDDEIGNVSD